MHENAACTDTVAVTFWYFTGGHGT